MGKRLHLHGKKLGTVACSCHPRDGEKLKIGRLSCMLAWAKRQIISPK
jgi:hypothetical protein